MDVSCGNKIKQMLGFLSRTISRLGLVLLGSAGRIRYVWHILGISICLPRSISLLTLTIWPGGTIMHPAGGSTEARISADVFFPRVGYRI